MLEQTTEDYFRSIGFELFVEELKELDSSDRFWALKARYQAVIKNKANGNVFVHDFELPFRDYSAANYGMAEFLADRFFWISHAFYGGMELWNSFDVRQSNQATNRNETITDNFLKEYKELREFFGLRFPDVLLHLCDTGTITTRKAIARLPDAPEQAIKQLIVDDNEGVRQVALKHPRAKIFAPFV
jgi:hypothetical protein